VKRSELNDMNGVETVQIYDFLVYLAPNTPGTGKFQWAGLVHFHWLCALPQSELHD
jgi:hypothetical protein